MKSAWDDTWRWTLVVLAICLVVTLALYHTRGWIWLGVQPIGDVRAPFSDAAAQLFTAEVCNGGSGEWRGHVCFIPSASAAVHAQAYEPWLSFQRWGLNGAHYTEVAAVLIALFYLAFCLSFRPVNAAEAILLLVFLFSAAVQLAVERANFDLLTSAMLCLAAWLLSHRRSTFAIAGCIVLGIDTVLKIYTGLSCACAGVARQSDRVVITLLALACSAAAIAILGVDNIVALGQGAPEGATRFSTGAHWLWRQHGIAWALAAATSAVLVAAMAWRILARVPHPPFARHPRRTALMQIAFLTAIPLFLAKDSYDYRFVLWLPCFALPMALLRWRDLDVRWRRFCVAVIGLSAFVFCVELPLMLLERFAMPVAADFSLRLLESLTLAKQVATWNIAGLLTVLFLHISLQQRAWSRVGGA